MWLTRSAPTSHTPSAALCVRGIARCIASAQQCCPSLNVLGCPSRRLHRLQVICTLAGALRSPALACHAQWSQPCARACAAGRWSSTGWWSDRRGAVCSSTCMPRSTAAGIRLLCSGGGGETALLWGQPARGCCCRRQLAPHAPCSCGRVAPWPPTQASMWVVEGGRTRGGTGKIGCSGSTEIRTQVTRVRVLCDNHYTIPPFGSVRNARDSVCPAGEPYLLLIKGELLWLWLLVGSSAAVYR